MSIRSKPRDETLPQNGLELSSWIATKLGLKGKDSPPALWAALVRSGSVHKALVPPNPVGLASCIQEARKLARLSPQLLKRDPEDQQRADATLPVKPNSQTSSDRARLKFFSEYLRERAEQTNEFKKIRHDLLGGSELPPKLAAQFISSIALQFMSIERLRGYGIPVVGHTTTLVDVSGAEAVSWSDTLRIRVKWPGGERLVPYEWRWFSEDRTSEPKLAYPTTDGGFARKPVAAFSVHEDLYRASLALSRTLPWAEHEALWFLLTGTSPTVEPITVRVSGHLGTACEYARITITAEPWVSADRVYEAYQRAQRLLSPRVVKPFYSELLELYRFVTSRLRGSKTSPTWEMLMREWNRRQDKHQYSDYPHFRRDYYRTASRINRQIIYPGYSLNRRWRYHSGMHRNEARRRGAPVRRRRSKTMQP